MLDRIVVTGYGIISSLGVGVDANKNALLEGRKAIGTVDYLDTYHKELPCGEIKMDEIQLRKLADVSSEALVTRNPLLAIIALKEAIKNSGLTDAVPTAFISGTTVGGMEKSERYYREFFEGKHTEYIKAHDCGYGTDYASRVFGRFDFVTTISTACSSAANSIVLGAELIKSGRVKAAIVGGSESISKFHLNGFNSLMILEHQPCRPFDRDNAGLNLGEGAAYLVLEREDEAKERGAEILCELTGYANQCDAYHQTATSPESVGECMAMMRALDEAGLSPSDISYINVHGTGTGDNDLHESIALKKVFGSQIPPFSSTKSYTGHTTSAAGGLEAVFSILALQYGFIPGNTEFENPIVETGLCPEKNCRKANLRHVMSNSFGFGGNDTTCIFSKYNDRQTELI